LVVCLDFGVLTLCSFKSYMATSVGANNEPKRVPDEPKPMNKEKCAQVQLRCLSIWSLDESCKIALLNLALLFFFAGQGGLESRLVDAWSRL
jgi:hypothetical protein